MPNIIGTIDNPENPEWAALQFDDGTQSPWAHDPNGDFRREAKQIAQKIKGMPPEPMAAAPSPEPVMPPPVTPEAASDWQAAQTAPQAPPSPPAAAPPPAQPAPAEPAPPARADVPMPAPGLVRSGQKRQVSGLSEESQARVDETATAAIEDQKAADDAAAEARTQQVNAEWARLSDQEKQQLAKRAQEEQKARDMDARIERHTARLDEISKTVPDPAQAFAGEAKWYAFMAAFGDIVRNVGSAIAGRGPVADPAKTLGDMIERSVQLQTQGIQQQYKQGLVTADQLQAERETIRARLATAYENLAKTQLSKAKTEQEKLALPVLVKDAAARRSKAIADAAKATAQQETRIEEFELPAPDPALSGTGSAMGPVEQELRRLGITREQYTKALTSKVGQGGQNAPTVASTAQFVKTLDGDVAAMQTLMKDGVMPNKVASNQITEAMRKALQRLNIPLDTEGNADLAEFNQRYTRRIIAEAKKMGGVITENDLAFTERVAGQSPKSILSWLQRMRSDANKEMVAALGAHFPDYTQTVADIMLRGQSGTTGVPAAAPEPFEITGGEAPPEAPRELSDVEERQRENRQKLGDRVGGALRDLGAAVTRPPRGLGPKY